MLARARATTTDAAITYRRADLETLELSPAAFDVVYSSLTLHYLEHLDRLIGEIHRALGSGGRLIFSVEHPIYTAPEQPGWSTDAAGRQTWPVDHYLEEGPRSTDWLTKGVIKQHRTIGTYLGLLLQHGFTITHVEEWGPSKAQVAAKPNWALERQRPAFLLVGARRSLRATPLAMGAPKWPPNPPGRLGAPRRSRGALGLGSYFFLNAGMTCWLNRSSCSRITAWGVPTG